MSEEAEKIAAYLEAIIYMTKRHESCAPDDDSPAHWETILKSWKEAGWLDPLTTEERCERLNNARGKLREAMQRWDDRFQS